MVRRGTTRIAAVAMLSAIITGASLASTPRSSQPLKRWTLRDILAVPIVTDLSLARDGESVLYATKVADLHSNSTVARLWLVDIHGQQMHLLLHGSVIEQLHRIPGTSAWSICADLGSGIQLYRVDAHGSVAPIVASTPTVGVGAADHSVPSALSFMPRKIGVLSYSWSPDGKWLWYAALKSVSNAPRILFDEQIDTQLHVRRPPINAQIVYHLRGADGADRVIARRPTTDRVAFYFNGNVSWHADALRYSVENAQADGSSRFDQFRVDLATGQTTDLKSAPASPFAPAIVGPWGGRLTTTGFGAKRMLVEDFPDGRKRIYGHAGFLIGDPRSAGNWTSTDGRIVLIGTRALGHPRYGLEWLDRHGRHSIGGSDSLTKCDFTKRLDRGVCIREGLARPPELVLVHPRSGALRRIVAVSQQLEAIAPLKITPKQWTNKLGYRASGFVMWPRDYAPGKRYPAIIITHGSDADERFVCSDLQWNYPAQIFAEEGYVVLLIDDPTPSQSALLSAAYAKWGSAQGAMKPAELQRLLWLNGVYSFESAIDDLAASGVIEPSRVGIAGYSRGSQMVNVAMTHSSYFRAASSGDGSYLEPIAYSWPWVRRSYDIIFGGSPYSSAIALYRKLSPSLRANHVHGAILQQLATPLAGAMDFYRALRSAGVPAAVTYYPGANSASDETHIFQVPSNRLTAMRENLAWFDFWLRGKRSPLMPFPDRFAPWAAMSQDQASGRVD